MENFKFIEKSVIAQYIYDKIIANMKRQDFLSRNLLKLFYLLRKLVLEIVDPFIEFKVGRFMLFIPFSHNLPLSMIGHKDYSTNLGRIAKLVQQKYKDLTVIDIGANIGDSVAVLRSEAEFPILCIEGEEQFFSILKKNAAAFSNVQLVMNYVGDIARELNGEITKSGGTAYINQSSFSVKTIKTKPLEDIIEHRKEFKMSKMIKIDTDGYDCRIIRGAINFLSIVKPVIFLEYDPDLTARQGEDSFVIFKELNDIGYRFAIIYDNTGKYMLSALLDNSILLQEIHHYFSGWQGKFYADICVFHSEDADLFENIRRCEQQYFGIHNGQK